MTTDKDRAEAVELREKLAELAHSQWAGWMDYLFSKCPEYKAGSVQAEDGAMIIPKWAVDRWKRQAATPYCDLSVEEKDSDRTEADKFLALLRQPTCETCGDTGIICLERNSNGECILDAFCTKCKAGKLLIAKLEVGKPAAESQDEFEKIKSGVIKELNSLIGPDDDACFHRDTLDIITTQQERIKELEATLQDGIDLYYCDKEGEYGWGLLGKWAGIVKRVLKNK
jgi:hypothetical protein